MTFKRIDANQPDIVSALRKIGAEWIGTSGDPNIGFDGIILFRGRALIAEVKDGSKPLSARKLTENELKRQRQCEAAGVPYLILLNPEQALRAVGVIEKHQHTWADGEYCSECEAFRFAVLYVEK